jgi:hypothetical protein
VSKMGTACIHRTGATGTLSQPARLEGHPKRQMLVRQLPGATSTTGMGQSRSSDLSLSSLFFLSVSLWHIIFIPPFNQPLSSIHKSFGSVAASRVSARVCNICTLPSIHRIIICPMHTHPSPSCTHIMPAPPLHSCCCCCLATAQSPPPPPPPPLQPSRSAAPRAGKCRAAGSRPAPDR